MPCTFSLSPSLLHRKLFPRMAAIDSLYLSETSGRALIFLHFYELVVLKSGWLYVSSIELDEQLDKLNEVDEQHGALKREELSELASMLNLRWKIGAWSFLSSTSREFTSANLLASKETNSSESWLVLVPKDKFFTHSGSKFSMADFTRFMIALNPTELIRLSGDC